MNIKIIQETNWLTFEDLNTGDAFQYNDKVYMKIDKDYANASRNAVDLVTGHTLFVGNSTKVHRYVGDIILSMDSINWESWKTISKIKSK